MAIIQELGITGVVVVIGLLFFFIGMIKGLIKSLMALVTLGCAGYAGWWSYHNGPPIFYQYFGVLPDSIAVICAVLPSLLIFYLLYRVFQFIANPFNGDEDTKSRWNFGFPAAIISLIFAACFIIFTLNRLRTTNELDKIQDLMVNGIGNEENRGGIHKFICDSLEKSSVGNFLFQNDPLWESNRAKLAKLAIIYSQNGNEGFTENEKALEILREPKFQQWIKNQTDVKAALDEENPSALWEASSFKELLKNKNIANLFEQLDI